MLLLSVYAEKFISTGTMGARSFSLASLINFYTIIDLPVPVAPVTKIGLFTSLVIYNNVDTFLVSTVGTTSWKKGVGVVGYSNAYNRFS